MDPYNLNLSLPLLRKYDPTALQVVSPSPSLSSVSTESSAPSPNSSPTQPARLVNTFAASTPAKVVLSSPHPSLQASWPESPDSSILDTSAIAASDDQPHLHQKKESVSLIGIACTTSPTTDAKKVFDRSATATTAPTIPPPAPTRAAPTMPVSAIPPRYVGPSGEPHSPVRTNSSNSVSVTETPPRRISPSPQRSQTQSTMSSVSSDATKKTPQHAATFPRTDSPIRRVNEESVGSSHDSIRGRNASGHNVLTKRAQSRDGSVRTNTPGPAPPVPSVVIPQINTLDPAILKPQSNPRTSRRMSFFGGLRSRASSVSAPPMPNAADMAAWVMTKDAPQEYNLQFLLKGEQVPELWNVDTGNVLVHLWPQHESKGPSFRVPATVITSSEILRESLVETPQGARARGRSFGNRSLTAGDAALAGSLMLDNITEFNLYIPEPLPTGTPPTSIQVTQRLVGIRNLFAMLTGQPLVGTHVYETPTAALFQISELLAEFGYRSLSGESFGEEVDVAFGFYMKSMDLSDIRNSRSKTIEALLLGEFMRSRELYDDAFAHFVGKYNAIMEMKSPLYDRLSKNTRDALDRAHLDLGKRLENINEKLESFNFTSVFTGIANSTSQEEFHGVDYKTWRLSYARMRTLVISHYKHKFGNWPPKASSKKNSFSESGLNRLVLGTLYRDMCAVYDLIADRKSLTPRVIEGGWSDSNSTDDPETKALRRLLAEYDSSSLPVLPPVPYDIPTKPTFNSVASRLKTSKDKLLFRKRVKENELTLVLEKSYDFDTPKNYPDSDFLTAFKNMELKEAKGKSEAELGAQRVGYWIFMYCVLQLLPWVVLDAPTVKHSKDVEYFLCQPATGNAPWILDQPQIRKQWFMTAEGRTVELSADAVMHSAEAVYRRSHCWKMAEQWEREGLEESAPMEFEQRELTPPGSIHAPSVAPSPVLRPRSNLESPRVPSMHRSSIAIGLEPINFTDLPPDVVLRANRSSMAINNMPYRQSMHVRSRSVGPGGMSLQQRSSVMVPGSPLPPMPGALPFTQHSNASGPALGRVGSPFSGRESVYDEGNTTTFDDILNDVKKEDKAAKVVKKKRSFFF